jgi:hypothetical protein
MGGIGKIFKSVASIAMQVAPMFGPAGGIFSIASKVFDIAKKVSGALKPLAPKLFSAIDSKITNFQGLANKAMGKAADFLGNFGKQLNAAGDQALKAAAQPAPQLIPKLNLPGLF